MSCGRPKCAASGVKLQLPLLPPTLAWRRATSMGLEIWEICSDKDHDKRLLFVAGSSHLASELYQTKPNIVCVRTKGISREAVCVRFVCFRVPQYLNAYKKSHSVHSSDRKIVLFPCFLHSSQPTTVRALMITIEANIVGHTNNSLFGTYIGSYGTNIVV